MLSTDLKSKFFYSLTKTKNYEKLRTLAREIKCVHDLIIFVPNNYENRNKDFDFDSWLLWNHHNYIIKTHHEKNSENTFLMALLIVKEANNYQSSKNDFIKVMAIHLR